MVSGTTPEGKYAVVREVAETLDRCVRTYSKSEGVNIELAKKQHEAYCKALEQRNLILIRVPADNSFPDCVFVEDPAIVYKQNAIICRMGAKSRMGEVEEVRKTLSRTLDRVVSIRAPATIDGGDALKVEDDLFVGVTRRTNMDGVKQLKEILEDEKCNITPVKVENILHFKSACSYIGDDYVVVTSSHGLKRSWAFRFFRPVSARRQVGGPGKPVVEVAAPGLSCAAPLQLAHLARRGGLRCARLVAQRAPSALGNTRDPGFLDAGGAAPRAVSPQGPKKYTRRRVFKRAISAPQFLTLLKGAGFPSTES